MPSQHLYKKKTGLTYLILKMGFNKVRMGGGGTYLFPEGGRLLRYIVFFSETVLSQENY